MSATPEEEKRRDICFAACAGMEDPAAEIAALREHYDEWKADSSIEKWFPYTAQELATLREQNAKLREPLAVIHRDGGHYTEEHGVKKSVEDALRILTDNARELDSVRHQNAKLPEALRGVPIVKLSEDALRWECVGCGAASGINNAGEDVSADCSPDCWVHKVETAIAAVEGRQP